MSFDYSTLITDRTRSDSDTLKTLLGKLMAEWTAEERTAFNGAVMKGSYDYTDLNRVGDCLEDLVARLGRVGCNVPGYERLKIERTVTPSSRLPEGYTEVQYIQSSGTQWIDTGFKPNQNTRMTIKTAYFESAGNNVCGVRDSSIESIKRFGVITYSSSSKFGAFFGTAGITGSAIDQSPHDFDLSASGLIIDGTNYGAPVAQSFQCAYGITIGAWSNGSNGVSGIASKIYACQIYDNGNLIRDFVPCIDPTGAVGLYDLVGGKFYGNAGTGVFLAGPPKATLPEGFMQVEYIQSDGSQFFDTGIVPDANTRVVMDFQLVTAGSTNQCLFGVVGQFSFRWYGSGSAFRSNGSNSVNFPTSISATDRHIVEKTAIKTALDRDSSVTTTAGNCTLPLYLLAQKASSGATNYAKAKLFRCQIFNGDAFARDFVPCKDPAGAVGLYDLVDGKFYGNAGTGSFTAGPVVTWEEPEEPTETLDPYTWYESDVPVPSQMARYRANVAAVRAALRLPEGTLGVPETMRRLTTTEANSIEAILLVLNFILNNIPAADRHCGVTVCGSKGVRA